MILLSKYSPSDKEKFIIYEINFALFDNNEYSISVRNTYVQFSLFDSVVISPKFFFGFLITFILKLLLLINIYFLSCFEKYILINKIRDFSYHSNFI